jgi:hypothetical protein
MRIGIIDRFLLFSSHIVFKVQLLFQKYVFLNHVVRGVVFYFSL